MSQISRSIQGADKKIFFAEEIKSNSSIKEKSFNLQKFFKFKRL
jgi:hypothetical protein